MKEQFKKFGKKLKEIRVKQHLSQGGLAKRIGAHSTDISSIERGLRNITLKNIYKLAKALGVEIKDLF